VILVDTSVWVDHLRSGNAALAALLQDAEVLGHPWVAGELAMGRLSDRSELLGLFAGLPQAAVATDDELMLTIEHHQLYDRGIGWVDAAIVASTLLTPGARLWTRDRHLHDVATDLGLARR
jgi:predicted nucleic acid-binding protein